MSWESSRQTPKNSTFPYQGGGGKHPSAVRLIQIYIYIYLSGLIYFFFHTKGWGGRSEIRGYVPYKVEFFTPSLDLYYKVLFVCLKNKYFLGNVFTSFALIWEGAHFINRLFYIVCITASYNIFCRVLLNTQYLIIRFMIVLKQE